MDTFKDLFDYFLIYYLGKRYNIIMLPLNARFDLFQFELQKDFFDQELLTKYRKLLNKNQSVITNPVDYFNESIQGVTIPGLQDLVWEQQQVSSNTIERKNDSRTGLGIINREPNHVNSYVTTMNPLNVLEREFKITCRFNQGFYNYFMIYEMFFKIICKPELYSKGRELFTINMIDDRGIVNTKIYLFDMVPKSIEGLELTYSKSEQTLNTFTIIFTFNNIDFDFVLAEQDN